MSTSTKKTAVRGKRYTAEEKAKVVAFIQEHNSTKGRGGQSAAAAKFGISQLTISSWLKSAGVSGRGKAATGKAKSGKGGIQGKLAAMLTLGQEIEKLEKELASKRSKFESLKASL